MKELILSLSSQEKTVLEALESEKTIQELAKETELAEIAVLRSTSYLEEKNLVSKRIESETTYIVTQRGQTILKEGLPEQQLLAYLTKSKPLQDVKEHVGDGFQAAIGSLKKQGAITIQPKDGTPHIHKEKDVKFELYHKLKERTYDEELLERGFIAEKEVKTVYVTCTEKGNSIKQKIDDLDVIGTVTPAVIHNETWKESAFRQYTLSKDVTPRRGGRPHFVKQAIDHTHTIWKQMGFTEMEGTHVQSAFWDLDALFVPQDHPAREMQDTFYLDKESTVPPIFEDVKKAHKEGVGNGKGWNTEFTKQESQKTLLRTHTTALSAKYIQQAAENPEQVQKYYSIGRVFRNEALDWKHLMEFHQVEGIVIGKELSFRRLIAYVTDFFTAMGYDDVRLRPGYFPYTEPSLEVDVYVEAQDEWMELGGAGVIRDEVTQPLGLPETHTVLAWGLGLDRVITSYYNIDDLREMYRNNLRKDRERRRYI